MTFYGHNMQSYPKSSFHTLNGSGFFFFCYSHTKNDAVLRVIMSFEFYFFYSKQNNEW